MDATSSQPTESYRHTQVGVLPIILFASITAICIVVAIRSNLAVVWLVNLVIAIVGLGVSYLTTIVSPERVEVIFGPKLFRRRIPVAEIVSAEPALTFPLEGWGIRITGEGMLYNISGDQAVRIHLRSGTSLRIGTDDPAGFTAAIIAAIARASAPAATA